MTDVPTARAGARPALLSLLLLLGGCGAPWTVILKSGPPSALAPITQVTMASDQSQMMVNDHPLPQEMAARDPEEQQALADALAGMETAFATGFTNDAGVPTLPAATVPLEGEARLTVRWTFIDPGKYAFIYARDSVLRARVVFSVGDAVVDEIEIERTVDANRRQGSIVERLRIGGEEIGRLAAKYFVEARQQ